MICFVGWGVGGWWGGEMELTVHGFDDLKHHITYRWNHTRKASYGTLTKNLGFMVLAGSYFLLAQGFCVGIRHLPGRRVTKSSGLPAARRKQCRPRSGSPSQ